NYIKMNIVAGVITFQCVTPESNNDKSVFEKIKSEISEKDGLIESINKKHKKSYAPKLFSLTDLQQEAYKRYHYGPKETLNVLQTLYERHKLVTYPRTDSNYLTDDMVNTLKDRIQAIMGTSLKEIAKKQLTQSFSINEKFINNQKVSDHHAIIPTEVRPDMNQLTQRETKIYLMIAQRFLENLMPPHEYEAVSIQIVSEKYKFEFKDKITKKLGFKAIYETEASVNEQIEKLTKSSKLHITQAKIEHHETTPPSYFNEGTLLKAMESPQKFFKLNNKKYNETLKETGGIGTVATRADIIEKLFNM
ncbi:DNA topoisomerase, partial [Staphylococcus aureus]|uniref:DNA topoisomerase n=1 Tax=Staphylococcus aureus TaxID=1280 RepID=UPI002175F5FA